MGDELLNFNIDVNLNGCELLLKDIKERIAALEAKPPRVTRSAVPVGTVLPYAGSAEVLRYVGGEINGVNYFGAPDGYEWCLGGVADKTIKKYSRLFDVIGYTYNLEGDDFGPNKFRLPNYSGVYLRGYSRYGTANYNGRLVGSYQACGAPNITGYFGGNVDDSCVLTGCFYKPGVSLSGCNGAAGGGYIGFDASRVSNVYTNGCREVIPPSVVLTYIVKL